MSVQITCEEFELNPAEYIKAYIKAPETITAQLKTFLKEQQTDILEKLQKPRDNPSRLLARYFLVTLALENTSLPSLNMSVIEKLAKGLPKEAGQATKKSRKNRFDRKAQTKLVAVVILVTILAVLFNYFWF